MGKPYQNEINKLPGTYAEARAVEVQPLVEALACLATLPTYVVGSGGSYSGASLGAELHSRFAFAPGVPLTPLRLMARIGLLRSLGVIFLSGGGSNPDVLEAFRRAADAEPRALLVLCARLGSPLAKLARRYGHATIFEFQLESRRDGFLATNSLLATSVLLVRAYAQAFRVDSGLRENLHSLMPGGGTSFQAASAAIRGLTDPLWRRPDLTLLYGAETEAGAVDLESRFVEAALGTLQAADLRNFAHGRHQWLARHSDSTAVLTLGSPMDSALVQRTLGLIPNTIPRASLTAPDSTAGALVGLLATTMVVAGGCGAARSIDPGRPHVPKFGRAIYHLRGLSRTAPSALRVPASIASAIERKTGRPLDSLSKEDRTAWIEAHTRVIDRLRGARFAGLAIDYDGTLCSAAERFEGPSKAISQQLNRILAAGIPVVIVTGRGKSVGADLRRTLDRKIWKYASVGYYNGAQVASLDDDQAPDRGEPSGGLLDLWGRISQSDELRTLGEWQARGSQLTLAPNVSCSVSQAWELLNHLLVSHRPKGIDVVRSGHTIDIIASGVSKRNALKALNLEKYPCLCIGDSGRYPGNDFELLDTPFGLSCGEVSLSRVHCWNLARPGVLGTQAAEYYLSAIRPHRGRKTFGLSLGGKA